MELAASEDAFFALPVGRYVAASTIAYWCLHERLWGVTLAGDLDESTAANLMRWIDREHEQEYGTYRTVFDMRAVRSISARAFADFGAFAYRNRMRQANRLERGVVLRPRDGMFAAAIEGSIAIFRQHVRWDVVDSLPRALAAIEREDPHGEIDRMRAELEALGSAREALRAVWEREPEATAMEVIARRLGLSVRSMQRRLRAQGTTYEQELRRARVRRAQRLLAETDLKLAAVALDAGFATPAHFSKVFRDETGESPSSFRDRVRATVA